MKPKNDHSYTLTRGLGGLFIFASFQFLENSQFTWTVIALGIGVLNMLPYVWLKQFTSAVMYSLNTIFSGIVFYLFIQMNTTYLQWLWLAVLVYYIIRLRDFFIVKEPLRGSEFQESVEPNQFKDSVT